MNGSGRPGRPHVLPCVVAAALLLGGCISGRILEGYPGYPFLSFDVPAERDSVFFSLQEELEDQGFALDFSERDEGLVNTRPRDFGPGRMFVSLVVDSIRGGTRAWVAGFEPVVDGARRISPLHEDEWAALRGLAARLSESVGGTAPVEPDPPGDRGAAANDAPSHEDA